MSKKHPYMLLFVIPLLQVSLSCKAMNAPRQESFEIKKLEEKLEKALKEGYAGKAQKLRDKISALQQGNNKKSALFQKIANSISFGASQPSAHDFRIIMQKYRIRPKFFVDVDLRGEPHIFVKGIPHYLEPLNFTRTEDLIAYEQEVVKSIKRGPTFIKEMQKQKKTIIYAPVEIPQTADVQTEMDITNDLGITYLRIPNDDHACPTMKSVYQFILAVRPHYKDIRKTFLIHCNGGQGRTTFYAIVLDILLNAKKDSLDTIIQRQSKKFSPSLLKEKEKASGKRLLLEAVYDYVRENKDNFETPPSIDIKSCEWIEEDVEN